VRKMAQETLEKFEGENKENNFKQTEIGLIPEDWEVVKLEEIGKIITGNTPSKRKKEYWENGEIDFIKPPDFKNSYITTFSEKISLKAKDKARIVPEKSILVSCIGIIGRVGYTLKPVAFNQQINAIIPFSDKIDNLFLFFALQTQVKQIESLKSVTTVPIVNKAKFSHVKIPFPPLEEQRKIARVLDKIQQAIELQDRIIEQAKNLKKSLMQKLFTEGLYGEEQKETEIGLIPKSWEVVRLGDGEILKETQYGLSVRGKKEGKYPILRMNNLVNGLISINDLQFVDLDEKTFRKFKLEKGDILFNRTNSFELVGKTSIFHLDGDSVFASYLIRLRLNSEIIDPFFFNFYFNWDMTQLRLKGLASRGVSQANISATKLKSFLIPLPPLEEQKQIAHILSVVDEKIEVEQKRKQVLKELFKTMLHKLMSGEIRLKEVKI